jgi:hypothetical protein
MFQLTHFTMGDMTKCGMELRKSGMSSNSMEEAAGKIVHFIYNSFIDPETGKKSMALVRLFKTHNYMDLDQDLQASSNSILSFDEIPANMKCLTLLATVGDEPEWNSRDSSEGHKAIPLPSVELVRKFPMVSNLVKQFGLELNSVLNPDPSCLQDLEETTYNVFLVSQANGSAYIPAQDDFVIPYGIKSVLGCGGILPTGNLFAVIMFSKQTVSREVADLFKPLTLSIKMSLLKHDMGKVFS